MAIAPADVLRELRELIDALDRRVPQVQRAGELAIARDAAALRARAVKRIEEIEPDRAERRDDPSVGAAVTREEPR